MRRLKVAIVGAGPAGMAAAIELDRQGVQDIMVFERNEWLGGILGQCIHTGFGLSYYRQELTGPEYAEKLSREFVSRAIPHRLNTMVTELTHDRTLTATSREHGIERFAAESVIIATGCRERTRENIEVAGLRPEGVYMAGQAQTLINLQGRRLGRNVIIQGSGDIGLIMARRFRIEGYNVIGVFERLPYLSGLIRNKVQCLDSFGTPIHFSSQICSIEGTERVTGVRVRDLDASFQEIEGSEKFYPCDTAVFSVGLIQEVELLKSAGGEVVGSSTPRVNSSFETSVPGVFVCGNSLHIHDLADQASREGEKVARRVERFLTSLDEYSAQCTDKLPYRDIPVNDTYTEAFFERLRADQATVCIVCPQGCIVSDGEFHCARGQEIDLADRSGTRMILTTTVSVDGERVPVRSTVGIDVSRFEAVTRTVKQLDRLADGEFTVEVDGDEIPFVTRSAVS